MEQVEDEEIGNGVSTPAEAQLSKKGDSSVNMTKTSMA